MSIRVIPCLLLRRGGIVKSIKFKDHKYIGDPINAVRIFNDKEVDELVFLDISARALGNGPDFRLLADIASEAFMPFAYGGGIRGLDDIKRLYELGVEKIVLNSIAHERNSLISDAAEIAGSSGVVISIDVRKSFFGKYTVVTHGGTRDTGICPVEYVKHMAGLGAGEVLLNSIDCDGVMKGYDERLINNVSRAVTIPVVAVGGARNIDDFRLAVRAGASAVGAGSMFLYHGRQRGILITYPSYEEIKGINSESS